MIIKMHKRRAASLTQIILLSLFLLCLEQAFIFAQTTTIDKDKEIPPWMDDLHIKGQGVYLVPKGAKVQRITSGHMFIEPPNEYAARRFFEVEEHLTKVEQRQNDTQEQLEKLKKELAELRQQCTTRQDSPHPEDVSRDTESKNTSIGSQPSP